VKAEILPLGHQSERFPAASLAAGESASCVIVRDELHLMQGVEKLQSAAMMQHNAARKEPAAAAHANAEFCGRD
jgi:hypothetical protein